MPLNIRSEDVNRLADELARRNRTSKTDAVRTALANELARQTAALPLWERTRAIRAEVASWPTTGLDADKAFYDSLNDE